MAYEKLATDATNDYLSEATLRNHPPLRYLNAFKRDPKLAQDGDILTEDYESDNDEIGVKSLEPGQDDDKVDADDDLIDLEFVVDVDEVDWS